MADHHEHLKIRLGELGLAPHREEEILRELGDYLEDHTAALEACGMPADAAAQEVLDSVSDWPEIRKNILAAERGEMTMNYRTKALWLPALCALTLSNVLLAGMQIFGPFTHLDWLNPYMRMRPFYVFLVPWLISQPAVGAIAAYWSRCAGGTVRHQLLAALAPAIALLGVFLLIIPFSIVLDRNVANHIRLNAFLLMTVMWVLLPSLPLLLGAAPFLRRPQAHAGS